MNAVGQAYALAFVKRAAEAGGAPPAPAAPAALAPPFQVPEMPSLVWPFLWGTATSAAGSGLVAWLAKRQVKKEIEPIMQKIREVEPYIQKAKELYPKIEKSIQEFKKLGPLAKIRWLMKGRA